MMAQTVYTSAIWGLFSEPPQDKRINQTGGWRNELGVEPPNPPGTSHTEESVRHTWPMKLSNITYQWRYSRCKPGCVHRRPLPSALSVPFPPTPPVPPQCSLCLPSSLFPAIATIKSPMLPSLSFPPAGPNSPLLPYPSISLKIGPLISS